MSSEALLARVRELEQRLAASENSRAELGERLAASEQARAGLSDRLDRCAGQKRTAEALKLARIIVENSPVVLFRRTVGDDARLVFISDNVGQWGHAAEDFLSGKLLFQDIIHPDDRERMVAEIQEHGQRDAEEYVQKYRVLTKDGQERWVHDRTSVVRDESGRPIYRQGIVIDMHEQKLAAMALAKSEEKLRRILLTAAEGYVFMDTDLVIREVNDAYCAMLGYQRDDIIGRTTFDLATERFKIFLRANRDRLLGMECRRFEGALLARDGREIPVLLSANTLRDDAGRELGHVAFVADLSDQKKALLLAEEVQKSLLPRTPPLILGLDIAGRSVSCDEIGGDYFDYFETIGGRDDVFGAVVGDISGHGVDAALLMTTARGFLRMRASTSGSLADIVADLNRYLCRDLEGTGRFMTLFTLLIDQTSGEISWVRAGHDPALVYAPRNDAFAELMGKGLPLGIVKESRFEELRLDGLGDGGIVAIGTDGIWEANDEAGRMFGKDRFKRIIRENASASAQDILDAVYEDLARHTANARPKDDVTLVIIKKILPD